MTPHTESLNVNSVARSASILKIVNPLGRIGNHEMAVQERFGTDELSQTLYNRGSKRQVGHKSAIHNIHMNRFSAIVDHQLRFLAKAARKRG